MSQPTSWEINQLKLLGYFYSDPCYQWDYPHLIKGPGIIPYYPGVLQDLQAETSLS